MQLTHRQLATVLAALRYWQQDIEANEDPPISEHFQDTTPLSPEEIDTLCESLNTTEPEFRHRNSDTDHSTTLRDALTYLLEQTVEQDIAHGIPLTEGEQEAREQALAALRNTLPPRTPQDQEDTTPEESERRETIFDLYLSQHTDETIEVDDNFTINDGSDNGCFISARLWIDFSGTALDKEQDPSDPSDLPDCTTCNDGTCAWCQEEMRQRNLP